MTKFNPRAQWIWRQRGLSNIRSWSGPPKYEEEGNRYFYFRKVIEILDAVRQANVFVSADGRYVLYVNGQQVGRGPARCSPAWQDVDPRDLRPYLRPGRNTIAALVHSYGRNTAWYELPIWEQALVFGCGGFFLEGDVVEASGRHTVLDTNDSWKYQESLAWERNVPGNQLGYLEIYDARRAPQGWNETGFDDSDWQQAEVLRVRGRYSYEVTPFPVMVVRDIPYLPEEFRRPRTILQCGEVTNQPQAASIGDQLSLEQIGPLNVCRVQHQEALLDGNGRTEILTAGNQSVSLVVDFGMTTTGRVQFDVDAPAGAIIDFSYSEWLTPEQTVHVPADLMEGALQAHRVTLRGGRQTWERFEWNGFQYLQVTFRNCETPLLVHALGVNFWAYPFERKGSFECSDELLNRIWDVSADTLQLCTHDAYEDCPSREQRQWVDDQYVQLHVNYATFGDSVLTSRLLRQVGQSQRNDGRVMHVAPGDVAARTDFDLPGLTASWIMSFEPYVRYIGDLELVSSMYPAVAKGIGFFVDHLDQDDLVSGNLGWICTDWADVDQTGQTIFASALFVGALRAAAALAPLCGYQHDVARYDAIAEQVIAGINRHLWDEERGAYVDARAGGVRSRRISQQGNCLVIALDIAPRERWSRILSRILDPDRLVLTAESPIDRGRPGLRPYDEEHDVIQIQSFWAHYFHKACAKAELYQHIVDHIRQGWGGMLEKGYKTWPEVFDPQRPKWSKCHSYAATPGYDLPTYILGITPTAPGFARFLVAPHLVDLTWAKGVFPSIRGDIPVTWELQGDYWELTIGVPEQTIADVRVPIRNARLPKSIQVDGIPMFGPTVSLSSGNHTVVAHYDAH